MKIKADLHYHGAIGFQPYWLRMQGYSGKNLAGEIAETALAKDIGLVAITSEEDFIPKDDLVHDRFSRLVSDIKKLDGEYESEKLDDIALVIKKKNNKRIIIVNGQTVKIDEKGHCYEHLVIGSNQVPNHKSLDCVALYCLDKGLIQVGEHLGMQNFVGLPKSLFEKYINYFDAVEGHNSQMLIPEFLSFLPVIGIANKRANKTACELAEEHRKPYISTSDGHTIQDLGISYIEFEDSLLDLSDGNRFLSSLRDVIKNNRFDNSPPNYANFFKWLAWNSLMFSSRIKSIKNVTDKN